MRRTFVWATLAVAAAVTPLAAQQTISEFTREFEKRDGFFPIYWDGAKGRLFLEIPRLDESFLYMTSQATGFGHTSLGDRGEISDLWIASFQRVGPKILLVFSNPRFRAVGSDNPTLHRSIEESFPTSTVAAFDIAAADGNRVLVDATAHFVQDHLDVAEGLRRGNQGSFSLNRDRSTVYLDRTRAFPENTEVETSLTFTSNAPGGLIRQHAPDGRAVTVRQHHSLVKLPGPGFTPRVGDPRIGNFGVSFYDFARSLDQRYETRYISRHRLQKRNPNAARSEPVTPIVYYLDPAIPAPYRAAFREGALWWNRVFEAAGFTNAFQVRDMPADMDPMDARYHVIQWVHRSNAGFSIGPSFVDPRTGEIIKAAVRMDTWRSLTDYNLYAGTLPATGEPADFGLSDWLASLDPDATGDAFAMARRRQHVAHEVGHTLGLSHNFVAAADGRSSVMDYPGPYIQLRNGRIDVSDAYRPGPGAYDSLAIRYGYTEFRNAAEEAQGLQRILQEMMRAGIRFNADGDNATWSSHPDVTQWANGRDALAELTRVMTVRRTLIDRFDERAIPAGEPMVMLNYRFVPVYLHHRYALESAIKAVGGMEFRYAVRGDGMPPTSIVPAARQRQALELTMQALEPTELAIPTRIIDLMAPRAFGVGTDEWFFGSDAYPAFDQLGAARTLSAMIVGNLLARQRAARLVALHARDPELPSLEEVIGRLIERTWQPPARADEAALKRVVQRVVIDQLIELAGDRAASVESRAGAEWGLRRVVELIEQQNDAVTAPAVQAHLVMAWADIDRFLNRRDGPTERSGPRSMPPGTPIGN